MEENKSFTLRHPLSEGPWGMSWDTLEQLIDEVDNDLDSTVHVVDGAGKHWTVTEGDAGNFYYLIFDEDGGSERLRLLTWDAEAEEDITLTLEPTR